MLETLKSNISIRILQLAKFNLGYCSYFVDFYKIWVRKVSNNNFLTYLLKNNTNLYIKIALIWKGITGRYMK